MGAATGDRKWAVPAILISLMTVFLGLVSMANVTSNAAATTANEASDQAAQVAADLSIHDARQNGSLEQIQGQLGTLRGYHSTHRGDIAELREDIDVKFAEHRKLLDELLRHSYSEHSPAP